MIRAKDTIFCKKLFQNFSLRFIFGCSDMLKCIHRLYADSLIFTIYNSTQLVKLNFFKYKILKISAAFYSSNSYLPVFRGKKVIFAIICHLSLICHAGKYREIPPGNTGGGIFRPTLCCCCLWWWWWNNWGQWGTCVAGRFNVNWYYLIAKWRAQKSCYLFIALCDSFKYSSSVILTGIRWHFVTENNDLANPSKRIWTAGAPSFAKKND